MPEAASGIVRQAGRFLVVGGAFTALDVALHYVLMFRISVGERALSEVFGLQALSLLGLPATAQAARSFSFGAFKLLTSGIAIVGSFWFNRQWTFEIRDPAERGRQFLRFIAVSLSGLLINSGIAAVVNSHVPGSRQQAWLVSTLVAVASVTIWNFAGHRYWTFRRSEPSIA